MSSFITGIQQIGIGVADANAAKHLYKDLFGMNVLIFEDKAAASLMARYTGGQIHTRHAVLTMNLSGGGGFEIWQFTSRAPLPQPVPMPGDIGIFAAKIKTQNAEAAHAHFIRIPSVTVSHLLENPESRTHFWITDNYGNHFNIVESDDWFEAGKGICGGVAGAVIGVSDLDKSIEFYRKVLGADEVIYSTSASGKDLPSRPEAGKFKRALLRKQPAGKGAFCKLLGSVQIELIQILDSSPKKLYNNRFWGDCGFIHLCFDVVDMDALKNSLEEAGFNFTIDSSSSFSMGSAAGRFCYLEDPDGTLIELVETHRVPILKKINWNLNLEKRKKNRPLPDWMIKMLALSKVE